MEADRRTERAYLIQPVQAYGPKPVLNQTAQLNEVADWMAIRTDVNQSKALMLLQELNEAIIYFNRQGTLLKLLGIGIFSPSVDWEGNIRINLHADSKLKRA